MADRIPQVGDVIRRGGNRDDTTITVTVDQAWAGWLVECGGWVIFKPKPKKEQQ